MFDRTARRGRRAMKARRGSIVVLSAVMMVLLIAMLAFAVDVGYIVMVKTELQRAADAAAIAASWELIDEDAPSGAADLTDDMASARAVATTYCAANTVCNERMTVSLNEANVPAGGILLGYLSDPSDQSVTMDLSDPTRYNAVRVRVRRSVEENGLAPLFFARALGFDGAELQAEATAALLRGINGFRIPKNDCNLDLLPFAMDEDTWNRLAELGGDDWSWNPLTEAWNSDGTITSVGDGVKELNLYPDSELVELPPGNRGTVDIGGSDNSTNDIARQILHGVSEADLAYFGGELSFDDNGILILNGDTGISAGVKDELAAIKGKPRMIPIFREVSGPGNNAMYSIVAFAGIRIMHVKLTGPASEKCVIIQPANCVTAGAIPPDGNSKSEYIYSPTWLVR